MAATAVDKVFDELGKMTVLDLVELKKKIEDEWAHSRRPLRFRGAVPARRRRAPRGAVRVRDVHVHATEDQVTRSSAPSRAGPQGRTRTSSTEAPRSRGRRPRGGRSIRRSRGAGARVSRAEPVDAPGLAASLRLRALEREPGAAAASRRPVFCGLWAWHSTTVSPRPTGFPRKSPLDV